MDAVAARMSQAMSHRPPLWDLVGTGASVVASLTFHSDAAAEEAVSRPTVMKSLFGLCMLEASGVSACGRPGGQKQGVNQRVDRRPVENGSVHAAAIRGECLRAAVRGHAARCEQGGDECSWWCIACRNMQLWTVIGVASGEPEQACKSCERMCKSGVLIGLLCWGGDLQGRQSIWSKFSGCGRFSCGSHHASFG